MFNIFVLRIILPRLFIVVMAVCLVCVLDYLLATQDLVTEKSDLNDFFKT